MSRKQREYNERMDRLLRMEREGAVEPPVVVEPAVKPVIAPRIVSRPKSGGKRDAETHI